ncbi:hypothetical protein [Mucilaginibacter psychrotolerans]|uniref:Uncharacterized protein n=1 Tax=Mucilaginibacter psychrotolerans TaxID=1524096 RepID=A0A4Y8SGV9_9SPHI|nr:hypothetical protein [Mucilaginibacter psychrotolerans]TFF37921.1 hypothetical protein E2R66_10045 [Mucilaginibacter psychrotolerans]
MTDILSILTLLALIYQLYMQRIHNEKSVKPLVQIDLTDNTERLIYIRVRNNGVGPFIAEKLIFVKDGQIYYNIRDCLSLNARDYQRVEIGESVKKVIAPDAYLVVFSKQFDIKAADTEIDNLRSQLAAIKLIVEGRDIYGHKITVERDLTWFTRHHKNDLSE